MPDICDLVLDEHEGFRRSFAALDERRAAGGGPDELADVWGPLAEELELHAAVEEEVFYPELLQGGRRGEEETTDAINDHNQIRDALRKAASHHLGSDRWWKAVGEVRTANGDHMAEEERGAVADMRVNADEASRSRLGAAWIDYERDHPGGKGADESDKDADRYVSRHS